MAGARNRHQNQVFTDFPQLPQHLNPIVGIVADAVQVEYDGVQLRGAYHRLNLLYVRGQNSAEGLSEEAAHLRESGFLVGDNRN